MSSTTFTDVFWLTLSASILGFLGLVMKQCFNSKCTEMNICCGLVSIKRDIENEIKIQEFNVEHGIVSSDQIPPNEPITRQPSPIPSHRNSINTFSQNPSRRHSLNSLVQQSRPASNKTTITPQQNIQFTQLHDELDV